LFLSRHSSGAKGLRRRGYMDDRPRGRRG
jgi:hypothetical protein